MKTLLYISGLLFVAGFALGQGTIDPPTNVQASFSNNKQQLTISWHPPTVTSGRLSFRVFRRRVYVDRVFGPMTQDSQEITLPFYTETKYSDGHLLPCYTYTYWVIARVSSDVIKESSSSDPVSIQIKGGVNAVVIYPTPKVVAVTGSPVTFQVHACDRNDVKVLFSLEQAPNGMQIDSVTGVITWKEAKPGSDNRPVKVTVVASDGGPFPAVADIFISVDPNPEIKIVGRINFSGHLPIPTTLTLYDAKNPLIGIATTISENDGRFEFDQVHRGNYLLSYLTSELGQTLLWYRHMSSADSASIITVSGNTNLVVLDPITISLPTRRTIKLSGTLTAKGSGVGGATVQAYEVSRFLRKLAGVFDGLSTPSLKAGEPVQTAQDGSFTVQVDSGGKYLLLGSARGYQGKFLGPDAGSCSSPFCAQTYSPRSDTNLNATQLSQSDTSGQQIAGSVTSLSVSSTGVRAMILLMKNIDGTITSGYSGGLVPFDVVTSDSAGNYHISSVPRDTTGRAGYMLQVVPFDAFAPSYYAYNDSVQNMILWEHARLFKLDTTKRDPVEIDVHVQPVASGAGVISGHVMEPSGAGNSSSTNAYVYAVDQSTLTPAGYCITDGDGNFVIGNLPTGTYALFADKISFHYALEGEVKILASDSGRSAGHSLVLSREVVGVQTGIEMPSLFGLSAAYPNPFSNVTVMHVDAGQGAVLIVYDMLGREIANLTSQVHAGSGLVMFRANGLAPGAYVCRLRDGHGVITRPLVIVR